MADMVQVVVCRPSSVMLEGGRAHPYQTTDVGVKWWHTHRARLPGLVRTAEDYTSLVLRMSVTDLRAECTKQAEGGRDVERGGIHEMRAALLDGIAPYEPSKHPVEPDTPEDTDDEASSLVARIEAADKDALKALADEAGVTDEVDLRYGADTLRAALLDAVTDTEDTDDGKGDDSTSDVDVRGEDA